MKPFTYERVTDLRAAGAAASRAGAKFVSGGTNLLDLMKLEIEQPMHLVDISRLPLKQIEDLRMAASGSERRQQTPTSPPIIECARATPSCQKHCFPAPRVNCETRHRSEEISCSVRAARISTTPQHSATSGLQEQIARRFRASIVYTRSSAQVTPASPRILPTWPSRCPRWKRRLNCWSRTSPRAA